MLITVIKSHYIVIKLVTKSTYQINTRHRFNVCQFTQKLIRINSGFDDLITASFLFFNWKHLITERVKIYENVLKQSFTQNLLKYLLCNDGINSQLFKVNYLKYLKFDPHRYTNIKA